MIREPLKNCRGYLLNRLAKKMQKGNAAAAEKIYNHFAGKIFSFLFYRVQYKVIAEDLTQDIFLKLLDKIQQFDPELGNFSTWFWQLARNTLIDYYRSSKNKEITFSKIDETKIEKIASADFECLDIQLDNRTELNQVLLFLKTLPSKEREIAELRFMAQLSFREMAEILKKSEGALRVHVMRLKKKIKDNFKQRL